MKVTAGAQRQLALGEVVAEVGVWWGFRWVREEQQDGAAKDSGVQAWGVVDQIL